MSNELLKDKVVAVYGAGGSLGGEVVTTFAELGASVFASSRSVEVLKLAARAADIQAVDALDEAAVAAHLERVVGEKGQVDVVLNLATSDHALFNHGNPAAETSLEQFLIPARSTMGAQFVTAKAAHKHMAARGSGTVLFITSTLAMVGAPWSAALTAAHAGAEGLMKSLASEWGPQGIRVLGVRSEAMPETPTIDYTFTTMGRNIGLSREEMQSFIEQNKVPLRRLPSRRETANVLAFAASDLASYMTGSMLNQSGGHILQ